MNGTSLLGRLAQPLKAVAVVSTLLVMPAILGGCSSSNTAPFTAVPGIPTVSVAPAAATLNATGDVATITFTRANGGTAAALTIPVTVTPAGVADPANFTVAGITAGAVTIPAGLTTATVTVTAAALPAAVGTVAIAITPNAAAYNLGAVTASTITINPPAAPTTVAVAPAVAAGTSATNRILATFDPATLTGSVTAGGVTYTKATLQTVAGKTVFVNSTLPPTPLASFTDINFTGLTGPAGTDFTTVCFEVDAPPAAAAVAKSAACP